MISFEDELNTHGGFLITNVGNSMAPLIRQGRDILEITKRPEGRLRKYDIPLYRSGGNYILHRILKVREHDYVIAGDHCFRREYITDTQIIGVLTGLTRENKRRKLSGFKYKMYLFLWCDLYPLRAAVLYMDIKGKALLRRLLRRKKRDTDERFY